MSLMSHLRALDPAKCKVRDKGFSKHLQNQAEYFQQSGCKVAITASIWGGSGPSYVLEAYILGCRFLHSIFFFFSPLTFKVVLTSFFYLTCRLILLLGTEVRHLLASLLFCLCRLPSIISDAHIEVWGPLFPNPQVSQRWGLVHFLLHRIWSVYNLVHLLNE